MSDHGYTEDLIRFLESLWGAGYMSPGGPEEVARVLDGLDLTGKTVLDIGCGAGGVAVDLVRNHGAARVIGIDVEQQICAAARRHVAASGVGDRVEIHQVTPGPFPFADGAFDFVFSKDSILHIPDKEWLAGEVSRVLAPGGWFAASDWLISHDGPPSPEMTLYIETEDLGFAMASPGRYRKALEAAGFADVVLTNRNSWYVGQARAELERLTGAERATFEADHGAEVIAANIHTWEIMLPVVESGEHCPHHLRGRKP